MKEIHADLIGETNVRCSGTLSAEEALVFLTTRPSHAAKTSRMREAHRSPLPDRRF
jgi:hypothetical protein